MPPSRLSHPASLDDMLLYRLWRLNARAGSVVMRMCEREFGITRREWRLLAVLAGQEGMQSSQLAERAGLDRARTSRALSQLVDKHLVARQPRAGNRREVVLHLTDAGRALHEQLMPRVAAINQSLLSALSAGEVSTLEGLLPRLQERAETMALADPYWAA